MTRVAYVSADLGVPIFGRKGCSIHAQEVLAALLRQSARIDLFSTRLEGEPTAGLEGICLHTLPNPPKGEAAEREHAALDANTFLRAELERVGPFDFVYERYSLWSSAAMEYARAAGVPGLMEVNAPLIEEQVRYRVLVDRAAAEQSARRGFGAATGILAVSDEVAAWLERFTEARGKIQVVPNGIRPERFPERVEPTLPGPDDTITVGFVGTLKAWHGLSVLSEAFALFHHRQPHSRLLVVGDGPEREKFETDLKTRGIMHAATLTGAVSPTEVPGLLASMDIAVAPYPPLTEFYFSPLKVYEYMAAGLAVVASGIGQLQKLIAPGVNGWLVPPGDIAALATALEALAQNAELRAELGRAARETVFRDFTWDAVAQRIFALAGIVPGRGVEALA